MTRAWHAARLILLPLAVLASGCSTGTINMQLIDANSGAPLRSHPVLFERGSTSTQFGYNFATLTTDEAGILRDIVLYNGDVIGLRADGYRPVESHVGYGSMTVSESLGHLQIFAALDKSARKIIYHNGDTLQLALNPDPATTRPITSQPP